MIIFSVAFGIYSFIKFINQKPMIDYYKSNDFNSNKAIAISDSFIIFKIISRDYDNIEIKDISLESFYFSMETNEFINLKVEPCEYGKNIDLKHQELFKNFEKREGESLGNYFCINFIGKNISLFHHPNYNNSYFNARQLAEANKEVATYSVVEDTSVSGNKSTFESSWSPNKYTDISFSDFFPKTNNDTNNTNN